MLRNESLAVGVNVDVAVRLFIVPSMRGAITPATADERCESDLTSNTTCRCSMVTIPQQFQSPVEKKNAICSRRKKKQSFVLVRRTKANFFCFVLVLACILRNGPFPSSVALLRGPLEPLLGEYRRTRPLFSAGPAPLR